MEVLPIDLPAMIGVIMGTSIVLVPVLGLTARFALKPLAEALAALRTPNEATQRIAELERRVAQLEAPLHRQLPSPLEAPSLGEPVLGESLRLRG